MVRVNVPHLLALATALSSIISSSCAATSSSTSTTAFVPSPSSLSLSSPPPSIVDRRRVCKLFLGSTTTEQQDEAQRREQQRTVTATATINLPIQSHIAFDTFTDFPRQPSWSSWLKSVEYLDDNSSSSSSSVDTPEEGEEEEEESMIRPSRWTARLFGIRYSWTSKSTPGTYVEGRSMGWQSTSGMKTSGLVLFDPIPIPSNEEEEESDVGAKEKGEDEWCRMTLTMSVRAPRAVAALFRRSGALERYFRDTILMGTLVKFRDVVVMEE